MKKQHCRHTYCGILLHFFKMKTSASLVFTLYYSNKHTKKAKTTKPCILSEFFPPANPLRLQYAEKNAQTQKRSTVSRCSFWAPELIYGEEGPEGGRELRSSVDFRVEGGGVSEVSQRVFGRVFLGVFQVLSFVFV